MTIGGRQCGRVSYTSMTFLRALASWLVGLLIISINIKLDEYAVEPRFKSQLEPYFSLLQMYDNKHYIFHMSYLKTPMFDDLKQSITLKFLTHCVCLNVCNFDK